MLRKDTFGLVICQLITILICLVGNVRAGLDAPHDTSTGTGCLSCHQMTSTYAKLLPPLNHTPLPGDIDDTTSNGLCWSCHNGTNPLYVKTHSSLTTSTKYGNWTVECWVCHSQHTQEQDNYNGSTYGKFIKKSIVLDHITGLTKTGTRNVVFTGATGAKSFADGDTTIDGVCEVCHTQTTAWQNDGTLAHTEEHTGLQGRNCTQCHPHEEGFKAVYQCLDCHDDTTNAETNVARADVKSQFNSNSHHVQRADGSISNTDCYRCHWEADSNGLVTSYHNAMPGAAVDLVLYGGNTRPATYAGNVVTYTAGTSASSDLNAHCLGCHDDDTKSVDVFGDGKAPNYYAWDESGTGARDGTSVKARYSQTGTSTWGKYTGYSLAAPKNITKAYSAHGNAANNARGWNTSTGVDGTVTNTSGAVQVACFDCHNSHGSTVTGLSTSYASATPNGGLLKDTVTGKGGYSVTYTPVAGGSAASKNTYNPGADLCFDCHMNPTAASTPWGYQATFNSSQPILGYFDTKYFAVADGVTIPYSGYQQRYTYKNPTGEGGHLLASPGMNTTPMHSINGLCTPCHDPHGVSPAGVGTCSNSSYFTRADCLTNSGTWTVDQSFGVPLLKGTWMTSPYKEDAAPANKTEYRGGYSHSWGGGSTPGYKIDQNTFDNWVFGSTAGVTQSVNKFAGLCLQCHRPGDINPNTNNTWKTMDRIHNTVQGWDFNDGTLSKITKHRYSCSKCHTPHNSSLPRLMVSNCLNYTHRGRVASGSLPGSHTGNGTGACASGSGVGKFPGGGGGALVTGSPCDSTPSPSYKYFFGNVTCHGGTWPSGELWNNKTPW